MTGLVDRINRAVLRRIRPASVGDAAAIGAGLEQLVRLVAVLRGSYVGDVAMLIAERPDGTVLRTDEQDEDWPALLAALDRSGRARCSSREWMLRLVANGVGMPVVLIGEPA